MSTETEPLVGTPVDKTVKRKKKLTQERIMVYLTLIFIAGLVFYSVIPEGNPLREFGTVAVCMLIVLAIFKGSGS